MKTGHPWNLRAHLGPLQRIPPPPTGPQIAPFLPWYMIDATKTELMFSQFWSTKGFMYKEACLYRDTCTKDPTSNYIQHTTHTKRHGCFGKRQHWKNLQRGRPTFWNEYPLCSVDWCGVRFPFCVGHFRGVLLLAVNEVGKSCPRRRYSSRSKKKKIFLRQQGCICCVRFLLCLEPRASGRAAFLPDIPLVGGSMRSCTYSPLPLVPSA